MNDNTNQNIIQKIFVKNLHNFKFIVPTYQRGYRWTTYNINQFIDDILYNQEEEYLLQSLIIKKNENEKDNNIYDLIDGQQRITTIILIINALRCINETVNQYCLNIYLEYESRKNSKDFIDIFKSENLRNYLINNKITYLNSLDLKNFFKKNIKIGDTLDFDYMINCFVETYNKFMKNDYYKNNIIYFYNKLLTKCNFILYEISNNNEIYNENQLKNLYFDIEEFTKINLGKIGLHSAELIKAEFMNPKYYLKQNNFDEKCRYDYIFNSKFISERWYNIESMLYNSDFWSFIPHTGNQYEENLFNFSKQNFINLNYIDSYISRISEIFKFFAVKNYISNLNNDCKFSKNYKNEIYNKFFLYNNISQYIHKNIYNLNISISILDIWREFEDSFYLLYDLYENDGRIQWHKNHLKKESSNKNKEKETIINLYNFMGYYLFLCEKILKDGKDQKDDFVLFDIWENFYKVVFSKNIYEKYLTLRHIIKFELKKVLEVENFDNDNEILEKIKTLEYEPCNVKKIRAVLFLYNILLMRNNPTIGNRFDFCRYNYWTIEHIYPKNPQKVPSVLTLLNSNDNSIEIQKLKKEYDRRKDILNLLINYIDNTKQEDSEKYTKEIKYLNDIIKYLDILYELAFNKNTSNINNYIEELELLKIIFYKVIRDENIQNIVYNIGICLKIINERILKYNLKLDDIDNLKYTIENKIQYNEEGYVDLNLFIKNIIKNISFFENNNQDNLVNITCSILEDKVNKFFYTDLVEKKYINIDNIENLTLLSKDDNIKLENVSFFEKRKQILELLKSNGSMPYSTLLLFCGMYSDFDTAERWEWLSISGKRYVNDMIKEIRNFFEIKEK